MNANVQSIESSMEFMKPKTTFWGEFFTLIGLVLAGTIIALVMQLIISLSMISFNDFIQNPNEAQSKLLAATLAPENFVKLVVMQGLGTFLMMALPTFVFAKIIHKKPIAYLNINKKINFYSLVFVLAISIVGVALSGGLGELTEILPMSNSFRAWAEKLEKTYETGVMAFVNMKGLGDYFLSLTIIAILPAIFEELLFRGAFQKILITHFKNHHLSIFITGFVFSLIHFSVMGFLSRMMLGVVLGYVFYYGKSIWLNIIMHFINNGIAITAMYIAIKKGESITEAMKESVPIWVLPISLIAIIILLFYYKKYCENLNNSTK